MSSDPFVQAVPLQVTLVSESFNRADGTTLKAVKPQLRKQVLQNELQSEFSVALSDLVAPDAFKVKIKIQARLVTSEKVEVAGCACEYVGDFSILRHTVDDWSRVPLNVFSPYFAVVHHRARDRVEQTLIESGIRGAPMPVPDELIKGFRSDVLAQGFQVPAASE